MQQHVVFVFQSQKQPIGMFKLIPHQHRSDHPAFAGRGEGRKMMNEIIDLVIQWGFLRIELSVTVSNNRAIRLYESVGFQKEGILKKYIHLKSEQWFIDEVMMALVF